MATSRKHRAAPAVPASVAALLAATALAVIAYAGAEALSGLGFDWIAGSASDGPLTGTGALVALLVWLAAFVGVAGWLGPRLWCPAGRGRPVPYRDRLRRAVQLLGLWALAVVVLALFSGLFAVGADWVARDTLEFSSIRGLVSATALTLALAVFPLFAVTAVAALAGGGGFGQDVSRALRRLGRLYAPLVLLALIGAGVGFLVWTLTGRAGAGWLPGAARGVALVAVGAGSIWAVFALAAPVVLAPPGLEAPPLHANPKVRRATRTAVATVVAVSVLVAVAPGAAEAANGLGVLAAAESREALAVDFSQPVPTTLMAQTPEPGAPLDKPPQEYYPPEDPPDGEVVAVDGEAVTYQTGVGKFTTTVGGPLEAFVDEAGQIQRVDNTLTPVVEADGDAYFTNGANELRTTIPAEVSTERGIVFESQGFALELIPLEGDYSHPVVQDNAVLYNSVFEGVDIQYTLVGAVVKEDIVLNWPVGRSEFGFKLAPGPGLRISEEDGAIELLAGGSGTGSGGEAVVFRLTAPIMQDAAGAISDAVTLELEDVGDGPVARVKADPEWLGAAERAYPVRIDPNLDIAPSNISLIGVEQGSPDLYIGDNGYPYSGYDDGLVSGNIAQYNTAHLMTRTYVDINYDFVAAFEDCKINSAVFSLDQRTAWSGGATNFGLYSVDTTWNPGAITWNNQLNSGHTFIQFQPASANGGRIAWDVREMVNNWAQGLKPNRGLVVKAENERWMQAEVFSNKAAS
ncbi:MAG: DNRLRE domain-containing protein, partial [Bifidobacteriaceae bacterium]|nr:DNRLRE domain-containing protein [Bifidobacteriaceae bacterium]